MCRLSVNYSDYHKKGLVIGRAGFMRCGSQLGTISVGPGSQSTCTKVCRIARGAQLGAIGPIGLRPALVIGYMLLIS